MESVLSGMVLVVLGFLSAQFMLRRKKTALKTLAQEFRFHGLRDELQKLVVEEKLKASSLTHAFLMDMLNFSIRNAGSVRLRDVLSIATSVEKKVNQTGFEAIKADTARHDIEVQKLTAEFFLSFWTMIVSNDPIVKFILYRPVRTVLRRMTKRREIPVVRIQAAKHALRYQQWAEQLS